MQMVEASADARTYDRETIHRVSDVWDNNAIPLFHALGARTSWGRDRRARAALAWMAALGLERRKWMVEQSAIAGYALEPLLPPPVEDDHHDRNKRGVVRAPMAVLTTDVAVGIGIDYDLATAEVRSLLLERIGGTRWAGTLTVAARRRYAAERPADEVVELLLWLDGVTEANFDFRDSSGITLGCGTGQVAIGMGKRGILRAAGATILPDDSVWHLSVASRALDERALGRVEDPAPGDAGDPNGALRRLRRSDSRPVFVPGPFRRGESILGAGAHCRASRREEAFRRLVPAEAELRLAKYVAAHTRYEHPRVGSVLIQLAVPPRPHRERDECWSLRGLEFKSPRHFRVSDTAFHGATDPRLVGAPEAVRSLSLSGGNLTVFADGAGTWGEGTGEGQVGVGGV
ncbi:hypothetical protein [Nonomuraea zeae]|uniref:Uncharacterized protein n=2 Tax=Nonomuraea zeae TaxID=1642303 RepID=A0A5S4GNX5_9ACTN|nr:hypothetical protein [Nonomuraea zeae]TMR34637.1 hypothetical protein ETD85_16045 [Nonomuraea zeae]